MGFCRYEEPEMVKSSIDAEENNKTPKSDYFLDVDDELLDYLEKSGENCIKEAYESNCKNKENGYKLLSLLILGIGSSFILFTQRNESDYLSIILITFSILWMICAAILVGKVLTINKRNTINVPPNYLYKSDLKKLNIVKDYSTLEVLGFKSTKNPLSVLRRYRLINLCETAKELRLINKKLTFWLDAVTYSVISTPFICLLIMAIKYYSLVSIICNLLTTIKR